MRHARLVAWVLAVTLGTLLAGCGLITGIGRTPTAPSSATPLAVAPSRTAHKTPLRMSLPEPLQPVSHIAHAASPHLTVYAAPPDAPRPVPVYWFGSPAGNHVYITIDDGWAPSTRVLVYLERTHLPVTAFLIRNAMAEHLAYWKAFVAAGGVVEDHTVSHPDLVYQPYAQQVAQWQGERTAQAAWLGTTATLGRPPYGGLNETVEQAAAAAGLKGIVMWSASMGPHGLVTWNGRPVQAGDIILLHWDPGLYRELMTLLQILAQRHLTPAPLLSGLPVAGP
ncbi:MAG: polysaccharide deacetylase family protein [Firmicutes bacterium]|nr:polysaccharide deacetylase family protein [Alicyclobacillaceae bacterium]MCL6496507.1 polysaccharide deacetylase family protein [Bacillota bacterium]